MRIQPVVEGHGEIEAVPVLLRRLLCEAQIFDVDVGRPIRKARSELATEEGLARTIALARLQPNCAAILVLFDGEGSNVTLDARQRLQADDAPARVQRPLLPQGRLPALPILPQAGHLLRTVAGGHGQARRRLAASVMAHRTRLSRYGSVDFAVVVAQSSVAP